MNDTRLQQGMALCDDARTLYTDILEENPTPVERVTLIDLIEKLNEAIVLAQSLQKPATQFMCRCGHSPNSHQREPYSGRIPCALCSVCDQPTRHHPDNHQPVPCRCEDLDQRAHHE